VSVSSSSASSTASFLRRLYVFEFDRTLRVQSDSEATGSVSALDTVGAVSFPEVAYLPYFPKLNTVPVGRNSSNHLGDSLFDFDLTNAWSLVTRYRKSLLSKRYKTHSNRIEAFARERRSSRTRRKTRQKMKRKKTKKLGQS